MKLVYAVLLAILSGLELEHRVDMSYGISENVIGMIERIVHPRSLSRSEG